RRPARDGNPLARGGAGGSLRVDHLEARRAASPGKAPGGENCTFCATAGTRRRKAHSSAASRIDARELLGVATRAACRAARRDTTVIGPVESSLHGRNFRTGAGCTRLICDARLAAPTDLP